MLTGVILSNYQQANSEYKVKWLEFRTSDCLEHYTHERNHLTLCLHPWCNGIAHNPSKFRERVQILQGVPLEEWQRGLTQLLAKESMG